MMTDAQPSNIFARSDTFFGVCEAIGQDFGFNPNWLRVAFAVPLIYSPVVAIAAYVAIGVIVAASRFLFPGMGRKAAPVAADASADIPNVADHSASDYAQAA